MKGTSTKNRPKAWQSAAAQRLVELAGGTGTVEDAIERLVGWCLQGVKHPPTDLDSVGAKLGITAIEAADIAGLGELRRDEDGFQIVYSKSLSPEVRRFTVAHEIGHVMLERAGSQLRRSGKEVERLCDKFAVELLMPRQAFVDRAQGEVSTQGILDTARYFRTSVATTGIRFAELCGVSVFACRDSQIIWGKGIFRPGRETSIDESLRPQVFKALGGEASADDVFLSSNTSYRRWHFECRPLSSGRVVLCLLRPTVEEPYCRESYPAET